MGKKRSVNEIVLVGSSVAGVIGGMARTVAADPDHENANIAHLVCNVCASGRRKKEIHYIIECC